MNDGNIALCRLNREDSGSHRVHLFSQLGLGLGAVNGGIGRTIDDRGPLPTGHHISDRLHIRQVHLRAVRRKYLQASFSGLPQHGLANLARATGQKNGCICHHYAVFRPSLSP